MDKVQAKPKENAILNRVVSPAFAALSPEAAKAMLTLCFSPADMERLQELQTKALAGRLTKDEEEERDAYCRIHSLLGILHSKARVALRDTATVSV
jgi:hypothetical protein